jgi:hypothetical protein
MHPPGPNAESVAYRHPSTLWIGIGAWRRASAAIRLLRKEIDVSNWRMSPRPAATATLLALAGLALPVPPASAQIGACCIQFGGTGGGGGICQVLPEPDCAAAGGQFQGPGSDCATASCPLFTRTTRGSGSAAGIGQFLDVMPGDSILISAFDYHVTGSTPGAATGLDVWVRDGTYREADSWDPSWSLHETLFSNSVGGGADTPIHVQLSAPIFVQANRTRGLFLHNVLGPSMHMRTNIQRVPALHTNGDVTIYTERYRFGTGGGGWNGNLTTARDFHGAVYYTLADGSMTGACCMPDGACQPLSLDACVAADGNFSPGADCAALTCAAKGACCYRDGSCLIVYETDCTHRFTGTFFGPNSNCPVLPCEAAGACCFPQSMGGGCATLFQNDCTSAGGTFHGQGTQCATIGPGHCWAEPVLWNNGPIVTGDIVAGQAAPAGTAFSELQPGNIQYGAWTHRTWSEWPTGFTAADDFTIAAPGGWHIDDVAVYAHRQLAVGNPNEITAAYLEIWNGPPDDPASSVVFGDQSTNRLLDYTFASVYRTLNNTHDLRRRVDTVRMQVNTQLPQGTYWIRYSLTSATSEFNITESTYVTVVGSRGPVNANAIHSAGGRFYPLLDDNTLPLMQQELAFIITGHLLTQPCYANCDGSTVEPILNVEDFTCFINEFANGLALPPSQQITHYANCDQSTTEPVLNVEDFICFIDQFAQGCP